MVYGPIAAFLVEMFPTKIRYTSMSLPYHIGNGWFGGMLPLLATAMVAAKGDIYYGLWYPIVVALDDVRHRPAVPPGPQERRPARRRVGLQVGFRAPPVGARSRLIRSPRSRGLLFWWPR